MPSKHRRLADWSEVSVIILILLLASLFRLYGLDKVPPAFNGDEANLALDAISITQGHFFFIGPNEGTSGSLWLYLLAFTFKVFGVSIASARGLAVVVSLAGLLVAYFLVRLLLDAIMPRRQAIAIAALVGLYLAVARWYVEFSRIAFSANLGVLIQVSMLAAMWFAFRRRQIWPAVLAGFLLGLTVYTYVPFRLTPFLLLFFVLFDMVIRRQNAFGRTHLKPLLLIAFVGGLCYLPIIIINLATGLGDKARAFTVFNPVIHQGDPIGLLFKTILGNLAGFVPLIRQVGGIPIAKGLDSLSLILFLVGMSIALRHWRKPAYLFLVVWWAVMLLPSIIGPEGAMPHLRRAIGTAVPAFALSGIGLVVPLAWLREWYPIRPPVMTALGCFVALIALFTLGRQTYMHYYLPNLNSEAAALANHIYDFELAEVIATEGDADTGYILPVDTAAGAIFPESSTLAFLYQGRGQATYAYIWDDDTTLFTDVDRLLSGKDRVGVVTWKVSKHTQADPRHIFAYILEKWGTFETKQDYHYFSIDYFSLSQPVSIGQADLSPAEVIFEDLFALTGLAWGETVVAGEHLWAELVWRKAQEMETDFQAALWLEDEFGHVVGRIDRPLLNNLRHRGTSEWPVGAVERDYYLIALHPATLPGRYRLKAILYAPLKDGSSQRLAPSASQVGSDLAFILGKVTVLSPPIPFDPIDLELSHQFQTDLGDGLHLLGLGPNIAGPDLTMPLRPGDRMTLNLWWQTTERPDQNWSVAFSLNNPYSTWAMQTWQPLGGVDYPTRHWAENTVVQTFADLRLPAEVSAGEYELQLNLKRSDAAEPDQYFLGQVEVSGRPRSFDMPFISTPLEANFAEKISLLGFDRTTGADGLSLVLYWQAQTEVDISYKVFVHLLAGDGSIIAQLDREPQAGQAPTTAWLAGEIITDELDILTPDVEQVTDIVIGLYNPLDGIRLPVVNQSRDAVSLVQQ